MLLTAVVFTPAASANSAEPPGLTIIVSFAPDDLTLSIRFADGSMTDSVQLPKEQKVWETYYRFFYGMVAATRPSLEGAVLVVRSDEKSFECLLPESTFSQYNNLLTLDLESKTVTQSGLLLRSILLVFMRVLLTVFIEGLIFFAFGYRKEVSWIIFAAVNLLTQGALNIALSSPDLGFYGLLYFVFYEFIVLIVEMTAFILILKEHSKGRAIAYTWAANLASLVLGGALISYLPV